MFNGEVFYSAKNDTFLGRECRTVFATLDSTIYKVLFRYITPDTDEYNKFRDDAVEELCRLHGMPTETKRIDEWHIIGIWDGAFGNAILDTDMLGTSVIYTSSMLRKRPFHWLWQLLTRRA